MVRWLSIEKSLNDLPLGSSPVPGDMMTSSDLSTHLAHAQYTDIAG